MKRVILCGDGMGDYPVESLGGKTPLQAAEAPNMRRIAAAGKVLSVQTIPEGMAPGSDVANLGLLGYNPAENYTGRAPIEAAGAEIPMQADDVAYRCNLVTIRNGCMEDYSAGHISTDEGRSIIADVGAQLGREDLLFHGGVSYRHLVIWRNGPTDLATQPPHDISGKPIDTYLPTGSRQDEVRQLMDASKPLLEQHPVNILRAKNGLNTATQIWLWGQGPALRLDSYKNLYGLTGGIISAVDLVRGIGKLAGLKAPEIEGATGFIDTNYAGKVQAALDILEQDDFVYVHIEAPDECGHLGDAEKKTGAISAFDEKVVGPIWNALEEKGKPYKLILCMDHRTPVSLKGHTSEPVPVAVLEGPVGTVEEQAPFDESLIGDTIDAVSHELVQDFLLRQNYGE